MCIQRRWRCALITPVIKGHSGQIRKAIALLQEAERPYICAGKAALFLLTQRLSSKSLRIYWVYPVTEILRRGLVGSPGHKPAVLLACRECAVTYEANMAMQHSDVLIAIGARFDDRVIGNTARFASHPRKIIHIVYLIHL
jgi:acetolactate synthase-1/2/3 large subunit